MSFIFQPFNNSQINHVRAGHCQEPEIPFNINKLQTLTPTTVFPMSSFTLYCHKNDKAEFIFARTSGYPMSGQSKCDFHKWH